MTDQDANLVPAGVRAIAALYAASGVYLGSVGLLMLARPGVVGMATGAPLLFGLELAGPYMFLLTALIAGGIAWGLRRLNNVARHVAILIAVAGAVMLVPSVSAAAAMVQAGPLTWGGLGIIVRVIVVWYLSRAGNAEPFKTKLRSG